MRKFVVLIFVGLFSDEPAERGAFISIHSLRVLFQKAIDFTYYHIKKTIQLTFTMKTYLLAGLVLFSITAVAQDVEQKLKDLKIELIKPSVPLGSYVKAVRSGNLIFLAGHGPTKTDGSLLTGKVGKEVTLEQANHAARQAGIALLSTLKAEIGDLNKVKRIVKVLGMVNCTDNFADQPKVMNGFSDLMVSLFGEKGKHARSSIGVNALPSNMTVEIEMVVEIVE
jgi:enamine deaminase RidA (YjgF/YER057c/UK114 family)